MLKEMLKLFIFTIYFILGMPVLASTSETILSINLVSLKLKLAAACLRVGGLLGPEVGMGWSTELYNFKSNLLGS